MDDTDRAILAFEDQRWRQVGNKERLIRERFDLSPTQYYRRLNNLLDQPEALEDRPALVNRLLRLRNDHERRGSLSTRS